MGAGTFDGDVRRLRHGGRGGSDDAPPRYRTVRVEDGVGEEGFHLTPLDIRKQEFRKTLRGFEPVGVEEFRTRVADEFERILRERAVLEERLVALAEQLGVFRERERAMNDALVAAQQLRDETRAAANREAQLIVREAQGEARRIVDEARAAEADVRRQMVEAERQFQAYLGDFRALLERQMAELKVLDGQREG
jgi:DivIVA domain-containing protein